MKQRILTIIASCLVLTGCVKDLGYDAMWIAEVILPIDAVRDTADFAKNKMSDDCMRLCDSSWWKTATTSDLEAQLNAGANVNYGQGQPLYSATRNGKPIHIKMLVVAGADVNARSRQILNYTPLHLADRPNIIKALISSGADTEACDKKGRTPLHVAAQDGSPARVRALLPASNVFFSCSGQKNYTALNYFYVPAKNMKLLVQAGADVNTMSTCGDTPLRNAAKHGEPADILFLLKAGANPKPTLKKKPWACRKAVSPLELASQNKKLKGTKAFYALRDATYK